MPRGINVSKLYTFDLPNLILHVDELLIDSDSSWTYGKYTDYFQLPDPTCIAPSDDIERFVVGDDGWEDGELHPHLSMTRGQ